jgi:hypothetical protein
VKEPLVQTVAKDSRRLVDPFFSMTSQQQKEEFSVLQAQNSPHHFVWLFVTQSRGNSGVSWFIHENPVPKLHRPDGETSSSQIYKIPNILAPFLC